MTNTQGAPYRVGDPINIRGQEATIYHIERNAPAAFGLVWVVWYELHDQYHTRNAIRVNEDGYNHNASSRVRPSSLVAA